MVERIRVSRAKEHGIGDYRYWYLNGEDYRYEVGVCCSSYWEREFDGWTPPVPFDIYMTGSGEEAWSGAEASSANDGISAEISDVLTELGLEEGDLVYWWIEWDE